MAKKHKHKRLFLKRALATAPRNISPLTAFVVISIVVLVGITIILITHALNGSTSLEPEAGTISGPTVVVTDPTASGDKYVKFGASPDYKPPSSIAADCSAEAGDALSSWIATVPNGSTISFPANGCYLNNKYIKVSNRNSLTFEGNNTTFRRTHQQSSSDLIYPNANPHWWFDHSSNITVRNMKVEGTNTVSDVPGQPQLGDYEITYEFEAAFRVQNVNTFTASGINIYAVWGDGFQLQNGNGATITSSTIARNGRQGMGVTGESNLLVDGVNIASSRRAGIDLENDSTTQAIHNVEIRNTTIWCWLNAFPAGGPGAVNNVYIHNNRIVKSGAQIVYNSRGDRPGAVRRSDWRFENNVVSQTLSSTIPVIIMEMTDNVSIIGNTVPLSATASHKSVYFINSGGSLNVKNNFFNNASSSYSKDSLTTAVTACSNKLIAGGSFDQPVICQ